MKLDIRDRRTQLGIGLVAVGLLALFGDLGLFAGVGRLVGLLLFAAAGALVLRMYKDDPGRIWTLPVGFGLLGLGLASLDLPWSGGAFLGAIGLGFLAVYLTDEERWWALIPAGVLLTLGVVATYDDWLGRGGDFGGTLFFLGLAGTFAALYLIPSVNQSWAIWPALGLGVVALLTMSFSGGWIVPVLLIAVGAWLLTRQSRPADVRPVDPPAPPAPPAAPSDPSAPTSPSAPASPSAPSATPGSGTPGSGTHGSGTHGSGAHGGSATQGSGAHGGSATQGSASARDDQVRGQDAAGTGERDHGDGPSREDEDRRTP